MPPCCLAVGSQPTGPHPAACPRLSTRLPGGAGGQLPAGYSSRSRGGGEQGEALAGAEVALGQVSSKFLAREAEGAPGKCF